MFRLVLLKLTLLVFLTTGVKCLNVQLDLIPEVVENGEEVTLKCDYDLEGQPLYALKYYRGIHEFYRYSPTENPTIKVFSFPWIDVNIEKSNTSQVTIRNVQFIVGGNFSCEITTDAPLFSTASGTKILTVVSLPKGKPVIGSERGRYEPGEILRVNCSLPMSIPLAKMFFLLNNQLVSEAFVRPLYEKQQKKLKSEHNSVSLSNNSNNEDKSDLDRQGIALNMQIQKFHYQNGQVNLRCIAKIAGIYESSSELQISSSLREPVPERVRSENACNQCHRITDLTMFGLMILMVSSR